MPPDPPTKEPPSAPPLFEPPMLKTCIRARIYYIFEVPMASSSIYLTPKRRSRSSISSSSSTEVSPDEKWLKSTISPSASDKANSDYEVMTALSLTESLTTKLDFILARHTMTNERLTKDLRSWKKNQGA